MIMDKRTNRRTTVLLIAASSFIVIYVVAISAITRISPNDMSSTAISETAARIGVYLQQAQDLPDTLDKLPIRQGYANRTTDGWDRSLIYTHDDKQFVLSSLGKDGEAGGDGDDADIVRQYRLVNGGIETF
jgi:hypothetical protein